MDKQMEKQILELVESNDFIKAVEKSEAITKAKKNNEKSFLAGSRLLHRMITVSVDSGCEIKTRFFKLWFEFLLKSDQTIMSFHSYIHYGIIFAKNLMENRSYSDAISILKICEKFYVFDSLRVQEDEAKRLLPFIVNMCERENHKIFKEKRQIEYSIQLIELIIIIGLKLKESEIKIHNTLFSFRNNLLSTLKTITSKQTQESLKSDLNSFYIKFMEYLKEHSHSNQYLKDFGKYIKMEYFNVIFTELGYQNIDYVINVLNKYNFIENLEINEMFKEIIGYIKAIESNVNVRTNTTSKSIKLLKAFNKEEEKLFNRIKSINTKSKINCYFMIHAIDILLNYFHTLLNQQQNLQIYSQSGSLSNLIVNSSVLVLEITQYFYVNFQNVDEKNNLISIKQILFKPLNPICNFAKAFENYFRSNNKSKTEHSVKTVCLCEMLQVAHWEHIKWLESTKLFTNDEIWKLNSSLESISIKITSNFLTDITNEVSTKIQKISFNISISKLRIALNNNKNESLFKNLQYVTDNLLLSLRMAEKYAEAIEVLDELNDFLKEFDIDVNYMELIVLNWFKIKRDGSKLQAKSESNSSKKVYEDQIKYKPITKLLKSIRKELLIDYLFEELRLIKYFLTTCPSNLMYDEMLCILNELIALIDPKIGNVNSSRYLSDVTNKSKHSTADTNSKNDLNMSKCRLYIEIAQFNWLKHLCTQNEYYKSSTFIQMSIDECLEKANELLKSHKCTSTSKSRNKKCQCIDYQIMKFLDNLYVFLNDYALQREKLCVSMRNLFSTRLKSKNNENTLTNTDNLQNLALTQSSNKYLLCSELHLNPDENVDKQGDFLKQLEGVYEILSDINPDSVDLFDSKFISLKNQLFASIDLLANLFGFFCAPLRKIDCLNLKFMFLKKELNIKLPVIPQANLSDLPIQPSASCAGISINLTSSNDTYFTLTAITILQLMKSYLNLHQFTQLNDLNIFLTQKTIDQCAADGDYKSEDGTLIEKNKIFANKKEFILTYYLMVSHYLILKKNFNDAVQIMQNKVVKSDTICGQSTAAHYEAKYYYKYLLFILSTINFGKIESIEQLLSMNGTPLSILEECYQAVFSVARFYLQSSIEPNRILQNNKIVKDDVELNNDEKNQLVFLNIGNAECYRILAEDLDIMQLLCKYYVELSRYREATSFIREGLDLTQCHSSMRRVTQFLMHQINTDLISSNLTEATARINLAERLVSEKNVSFEVCSAINDQEIIKIRNYINLKLLKVTNLIKSENFTECYKQVAKISSIRSYLLSTPALLDAQKQPQMMNVFNELFIEIYLNLCNALKLLKNDEHNNESEKKKKIERLTNYLKQLLIDPKSTIILNEKWYLAEYHLFLFEFSLNTEIDELKRAFHLIKQNPHPHLYKRICLHIFDYLNKNNVFIGDIEDFDLDELTAKFEKIEVGVNKASRAKTSNNTIPTKKQISSDIIPRLYAESIELQKATYLLETLSIALRHKGCSIHIKNKRKSTTDSVVYDNLLNAISFNKKSLFKYYEKSIQTQIPEDWTIISFIINDSKLYLLRLERNRVPFLFKLENFNEKVLEKFKQIIKENDASMKQNDKKKFWEIRGALNKRLIEYLKDIDKNLFDFARYFLLGSYSDKKMIKKCEEEIKKFYDKFGLKLEGLTIHQKQIVFYIFNFLFDGKILNQELTQKRLQENLKSAFKYAGFSENDCEKFYEYIYDNYVNREFKMGKLKRNHVCLLIDKNLHQIPWECLPIVEKQSITRMPSMHFLLILLETSKTKISKNNAYYIVDPAGDLVHTKQKFKALFEKQTGWEGIIGRSPDESEFKKALTEFELFIYTGHGSGSQYFPSEDVQKLRVNACSILMGCSSGNQYTMGEFEPYGTILAYILAGCPSVVGNLWDVTDRDIDRFTEDFLKSWMNLDINEITNTTENDDSSNICMHLIKARNACKLSHLNGSAPVIYGMPLSFE